MSAAVVARRYATALFGLGKEAGVGAGLAGDIERFASAMEASQELADALKNPLLETARREAVLTEVSQRLALSALAVSSLRIILRNRRIAVVHAMAQELKRLVDEDARVLRAEVRGAEPLSPAFVDKLRAELEKATGRRVVLDVSHDPSLIGGVVARVGDRVIDGSLVGRLQKFRAEAAAMAQGAGH